jgi:F0F1-type ATP synthase membrane subunit b/b'
VSNFVDRVRGRVPPEEREAELMRDPALPSPVLSHIAGYTGAEAEAEDETQDDGREALVANDEPVQGANDYAELGEHVAAVLETATSAAAKIGEDARAEARKLAERTKEQAAEVIETARQEADKVSAEARQLRAEAEQESRELRQRVNDDLAEKRQEAETQASAILTRAKREASEHTRAAQERRGALDQNVALTEKRLRQLVGGLRDLAGRLEELLGGQAPIATATDTAPSPSFEAALRPSAPAEQSTERPT